MASAIDVFVAYKFVRLLTTPWKKTEAYKLGIIDEKGKVLRKMKSLKTHQEKRAYTMFHRLVWNVKRILDKLPPSRTRIGSFATAMWMLKEHCSETYPKWSDSDALTELLQENIDKKIAQFGSNDLLLWEEAEEGHEDDYDPFLEPGIYKVIEDVDTPSGLVRAGMRLVITDQIEAFDEIAGYPVFKVRSPVDDSELIISRFDLLRL